MDWVDKEFFENVKCKCGTKRTERLSNGDYMCNVCGNILSLII